MDFPVHVSEYLGMNTVIAMIAIIHVMISHGAAVGGGTLVAYLEYQAIKTQNDDLDRFAQRMLRVFVIVTTTVGALTGVGIWISTTVAQPASIGFLLRVFFWAWFVEWLVFITEIVLLFIYYFSWKRLSEPGKANHAKLGRYYAAASFGTLVLIVGVLSAMLTPGDWLQTGSFFDATFNPTMLPSLFFRLFLATTLAGIYSLILFRIFGPAQQEGQQRIIPLLSRWLLVSAVLMIAALIWYLAKIPAAATALLIWGVGFKSAAMFWGINLAMMLTVLLLAAYLWRKPPQQVSWLVVAVIFASGMFFTFEMEMARESARKPFVIHNYMYANGIRLQDSAIINQKGILATARWSRVKEVTADNRLEAGREVYVMECSVCHTVDGVNARRDMKKITAGWSRTAIDGYVANLNSFRSFMPPFFGLEKERQALTDWIYSLRGEKP